MLPGNILHMIAEGNFPLIKSTATTQLAASTSHVLNMPAGIEAGDLLVSTIGSGAVTGISAGWTTLDTGFSGAYRIATGTAADALTYTLSSAQTLVAIVRRIVNYVGAPESLSVTVTDLLSHNPPAVTPTWGAKDTLWLATTSCSAATPISGSPANYNVQTVYPAAGPSNYTIANGWRKRKIATEDPSPYTTATNASSRSRTIAIQGNKSVSEPPAGVTLDPAKTGPGFVLSSDKLTVSLPSGPNQFTDGRSLSTVGYVVGAAEKKYFEVQFTTAQIPYFCSAGLTNNVSGSIYANYSFAGDVNCNSGGATATIQTAVQNDWVGLAVDFGSKKLWIKNLTTGSGWNNDVLANQDPATNTGGINLNAGGDVTGVTYYAAVGLPINGDSATVKFTGFSAPPAGFTGF